MKKQNSFTNKLFAKVIPVDVNSKIKLKLVIENFSWLLGDKILKLSLGMITTVLIARYLGPSDFGLLNYCIAFVSIISVISSLGLDQIIVRKLVLFPKEKHEIIGTAFFLRFVGSILLITLSIVSISIIRPADTLSLLLIVAISIGTAFQSLDVIDFWFQANLKS
ncbi:MAG: oligosaccharide flippase family protein, partial [Ignavibacteria bacterium]|nr:oligosaccharide flippase family protein [Ignavibacteria bacterium]